MYKLIWSRALASQMAEAVYETLAATLEPADAPKDAQARASVTTLVQKGFRAVYVDADADDDDGGAGGAVGSLAVGDLLPLRSVDPEQHFTKPPPRYNEGSLVSKMEELGVGRPSTYASVMRTLQVNGPRLSLATLPSLDRPASHSPLSTHLHSLVLQEREYVRKEAKALAPEVRGQLVTSLLTQRLEKYVQVEFTAALEEDLDKISRGDLDHLAFLERWWAAYHKEIGALDGDDHQEVREAVAESLAHIIFAPPNNTAADGGGGGDGEGATTAAAAGEAEAAAAVAAARGDTDGEDERGVQRESEEGSGGTEAAAKSRNDSTAAPPCEVDSEVAPGGGDSDGGGLAAAAVAAGGQQGGRGQSGQEGGAAAGDNGGGGGGGGDG